MVTNENTVHWFFNILFISAYIASLHKYVVFVVCVKVAVDRRKKEVFSFTSLFFTPLPFFCNSISKMCVNLKLKKFNSELKVNCSTIARIVWFLKWPDFQYLNILMHDENPDSALAPLKHHNPEPEPLKIAVLPSTIRIRNTWFIDPALWRDINIFELHL